MRFWTASILSALALGLAACTPPPQPLPEKSPRAIYTLAPGDLASLAGDVDGVSDPFRLDSATTVEVSWEYSGTGDFSLWMVNDDEALEDPAYYRILVTQASGATSGSKRVALIAGDYSVEVELADGPWGVHVKRLP